MFRCKIPTGETCYRTNFTFRADIQGVRQAWECCEIEALVHFPVSARNISKQTEET